MIVIIGNGISGVTAARYIRKNSDEEIFIISSESKYFFSRTALMYVYMGHMRFEHTEPYERDFWRKNKIQLLQDRVEEILPKEKKLLLTSGKIIDYEKLILATGSKPLKAGLKGEDAEGVRGLYSKQDLEYIESYSKNIKKAIIVGGGLIGIELAEMFLSRGIHVDFLVRSSKYWNNVLPEEDADFVSSHIAKHHVNMLYNEELNEIITNNGKVEGVKTKSGKEIETDFLGITIGVTPNIEFIRKSGISCNRGVLINRHFETSEKDIYAIGDCAEFIEPLEGRKAIEQVWYTGKIMGEQLGKAIAKNGKANYQPGFWFNSAKFFDLEYQTYGNVPPKLMPDQDDFVFTDGKNIFLHFVYHKKTRRFIGVNAFGIRLRHTLFNHWLLNEEKIETVIENFASAVFDPEFYTNYEGAMISLFNRHFGTMIMVRETKWWQKLIKK